MSNKRLNGPALLSVYIATSYSYTNNSESRIFEEEMLFNGINTILALNV